MNFEVQTSSLWGQTLFLPFCEQQALLQLILGGGFFLGDRYFSHMHILIVTQLNTQGDPLQISRVLFVYFSPLCLCPMSSTILGPMVSWNSILSPQLMEFIALHLTWITVLCSVISNVFQIIILYILSIFDCTDGRVNPVPIPLSLLEAEMSLVFRHPPLQ